MITSKKIDTVQTKIKAALLKIEKEENVKISFGTCRYNDISYHSRMEVTSMAKDKQTVEVSKDVNLRLSKSYGFDFNIIGKRVRMNNGNVGVIVSFKTRNRKYPIIVESNGKSYKMSATNARLTMLDVQMEKRNDAIDTLLD